MSRESDYQKSKVLPRHPFHHRCQDELEELHEQKMEVAHSAFTEQTLTPGKKGAY